MPSTPYSTRSDYYRARNPRHAPNTIETLALVGLFASYLAFGSVLSILFFPS